MKKKFATATFMGAIVLLSNPIMAEEKNTDQLIADLKSEQPSLQIQAAKTLGENCEEKGIPGLVELLRSTENRDVAWNAAAALGAIGKDGESTDLLIEKAKASQPVVQYASAVALLNIKDAKKKGEIQSTYTFLASNAQDDLLKDLATKLAAVEKENKPAQ